MNNPMLDRLNEISFVPLVKFLANRERSLRWYNFVDTNSHAFPKILTDDHKTFHYFHRSDSPEPKPVIDVVFAMRPEQNDFGMFESQCTEIFNFVLGVVNKHGFHVRPFRYCKNDTLVAMVFRIFNNKDFPCTIHPEYIEQEGTSLCPICKTEVVFGKFHTPAGKQK